MKYLSTALFATFFVLFLFTADTISDGINAKVMFWDQHTDFLNREIYMETIGWGIAAIFLCFVSYSMIVVVMLAMNLAKPNYLTKDRLELVASSHLLIMLVIAIVCILGSPVYQILSNSYILNGLSSFLLWFMAPVALAILFACIYALAASLKCFINSFKVQ